METLPSSIEAYLSEADFSGTEIIVLKKLLEEDALTLRELAAKTGKSTGVLDQAVKKLLKKKILSRETINDTPKYVLKSMNSILKWMEDDMKLKQEMMQRRHENFESFVKSLVVGKRRPEMEYFEGIEGIKRAYMQLLERGNDIVQYGPTLYLAEEDPLRDFRVQWFRDRRHKGIFSRVITHNTPLGRRFQSRDVFEYRKTILVDHDTYPFRFEKVIVGDTVACFQHDEARACFIKYPELAQDERLFFERLWNKKIEHGTADATAKSAASDKIVDSSQKTAIPLKTKTISQLRDFFLSKNSIAAFVAIGIAAAALTYGLYRYNIFLNTERIKEKVMSIAATASLQFDVQDLTAVRSAEDMQKPEYLKLVNQLSDIRRQNQGMKYAYLLRPIEYPDVFAYIADAGGLPVREGQDINYEGVGENDALVPPGQIFEDQGSNPPVETSLVRPTGFDAYYDPQWGDIIAGWAPIKDGAGKTIAILGLEISVHDLKELNNKTYMPMYIFAAIFALFIIVRLAAFNRSLLKELIEVFKIKTYIVFIIFSFFLAITLGTWFHWLSLEKDLENIKTQTIAVATTGAIQFGAEELNALRTLKDAKKEDYRMVVRKLQEIQRLNNGVSYAYILRPTNESNLYEFVAASDALNPFIPVDGNGDGVIDDQDEIAYPGLPYDVSKIRILVKGMPNYAVVTEEAYTDQWGTFVTAYAPITSKDGKIEYLLAIDMSAEQIMNNTSWVITGSLAVLFILGSLNLLSRKFQR